MCHYPNRGILLRRPAVLKPHQPVVGSQFRSALEATGHQPSTGSRKLRSQFAQQEQIVKPVSVVIRAYPRRQGKQLLSIRREISESHAVVQKQRLEFAVIFGFSPPGKARNHSSSKRPAPRRARDPLYGFELVACGPAPGNDQRRLQCQPDLIPHLVTSPPTSIVHRPNPRAESDPKCVTTRHALRSNSSLDPISPQIRLSK